MSHADNFDNIEQIEKCDNTQQNEPEPNDDVDLLVDHIDGQDAETIKALETSGRAKLVEGTLRSLKSTQIHVKVNKNI